MVRRGAAVLAMSAGMVLAGCSGDGDGDSSGNENGIADLSADQILTEMNAAIDDADTARIVGTFAMGGESSELDISYGADGGKGTLTFVAGIPIELLSVDGEVYMRGDAALWSDLAGPEVAPILADKYVRVPADDPSFMDLASFLDLDGFVDEVLVPEGEVTVGEESEINGQSVIGLIDSDGGGTLYVATTGEPLPIQIAPPEGESGTLDFEWGIDVEVTAPDEADVFDLAELLGG